MATIGNGIQFQAFDINAKKFANGMANFPSLDVWEALRSAMAERPVMKVARPPAESASPSAADKPAIEAAPDKKTALLHGHLARFQAIQDAARAASGEVALAQPPTLPAAAAAPVEENAQSASKSANETAAATEDGVAPQAPGAARQELAQAVATAITAHDELLAVADESAEAAEAAAEPDAAATVADTGDTGEAAAAPAEADPRSELAALIEKVNARIAAGAFQGGGDDLSSAGDPGESAPTSLSDPRFDALFSGGQLTGSLNARGLFEVSNGFVSNGSVQVEFSLKQLLSGGVWGGGGAGSAQISSDLSVSLGLITSNLDRGMGLGGFAFSSKTLFDPLVLDLAGDGFDLRAAEDGVNFDYDASGQIRQGGFVQGDDALLFLSDQENGGVARDGGDLFGDADGHANGYEKLATYDDNGDGVIDHLDEVYKNLRLWQEKNGDGVCTADEVLTLEQAGVSSINLGYSHTNETDKGGNVIAQRGTFTRDDGTTGDAADVLFRAQ